MAYKRATVIALPCADEDGDATTRSIVSGPAHGELRPVNQAAGTVTYTPDHGFVGTDSFSFQGSDATGTGAAATASLRVAGPRPGRCANRLRGTRRGEVLTGTRAGDRILGLGGNDSLKGGRGHDCLSGGRGRDKVKADRSDRLSGCERVERV